MSIVQASQLASSQKQNEVTGITVVNILQDVIGSLRRRYFLLK